MMTNIELIKKAQEVAKTNKLSEFVTVGEVGCALITEDDNIFLGVSIDAPCGIGFCAEHSAIASMVLKQEYKIKKIVAVTSDGIVLPPCGRCREFMSQINENNLNSEVIIDENKIMKLSELLPEVWQKKFFNEK